MVVASYDNNLPRIDINTIVISSSGTYHDPDTILASTLSTAKINYQGCGEYSLSNTSSNGSFPLDPHTREYPTYQGPKKDMVPQIAWAHYIFFQ